MTRMQKAFAAAERLIGPMAAGLVNGYGATNGDPDDVPEARKAELLAALESIAARGERVPEAVARAAMLTPTPKRKAAPVSFDDQFADVRAKAFPRAPDADPEPPQPVQKLDPVAIYARWNSVRTQRAEAAQDDED